MLLSDELHINTTFNPLHDAADVLAQLKDLGRKREALMLTSRLEARAAPRPRDSPKRARRETEL